MKLAIIVGVIVIGAVVAGCFLLLCMAAGCLDDREFGGYEKEEEEKDE